jgi:uridine kinase
MFFVLDFIVHYYNTDPLTYTVVTLNIFFLYISPEDGHRSGPKHVVVVHNKIEHEKHLLRTVVLIKVLMKLATDFRIARRCIIDVNSSVGDVAEVLKYLLLHLQNRP